MPESDVFFFILLYLSQLLYWYIDITWKSFSAILSMHPLNIVQSCRRNTFTMGIKKSMTWRNTRQRQLKTWGKLWISSLVLHVTVKYSLQSVTNRLEERKCQIINVPGRPCFMSLDLHYYFDQGGNILFSPKSCNLMCCLVSLYIIFSSLNIFCTSIFSRSSITRASQT